MNTENNDIPRNVYRAIAARLVADPNYYTLLLDNPRQAFKDALTKVKIIADKETLDKLEARLSDFIDENGEHMIYLSALESFGPGDDDEMI